MTSDDTYRPPALGEDFEDPEGWRSEGIIPQYPGTDHDVKFHSQPGNWRTPSETTDLACDLVVYRVLASALAGSLGIHRPDEFGALHGAAYDLVHDRGIADDIAARDELMNLINRMAEGRAAP